MALGILGEPLSMRIYTGSPFSPSTDFCVCVVNKNSVFVHYYPAIGWNEVNHELEAHYAVPPHWHEQADRTSEHELVMVKTSMKEPNCPNEWCRTQDTIQWGGPAEHGVWIAPNQVRHPLSLGKVSVDEL